MRTIAACCLAALLAATITATAANRGDPVYDKTAVGQLKKLNRNVDALNVNLATLQQSQARTNTVLFGDNDPHRFTNLADALDNLSFNIYSLCIDAGQVCDRYGTKPSP